MRDPHDALDLDFAIAERARHDRDRRIAALLDDSEGNGFFAAVLALLSE